MIVRRSRTRPYLWATKLILYVCCINAIPVMTPEAEKFNGWAAMLGFVAAFGAYATTGQIIPGIF